MKGGLVLGKAGDVIADGGSRAVPRPRRSSQLCRADRRRLSSTGGQPLKEWRWSTGGAPRR